MVLFPNGTMVRDFKRKYSQFTAVAKFCYRISTSAKKNSSYISPILNELGALVQHWWTSELVWRNYYSQMHKQSTPTYKLFFSNVLTLMIIQITQETKTISVYLCVAQRGFYYYIEHLKLGIIPLLLLWECARKQYVNFITVGLLIYLRKRF